MRGREEIFITDEVESVKTSKVNRRARLTSKVATFTNANFSLLTRNHYNLKAEL